jgi:hypothetical protein
MGDTGTVVMAALHPKMAENLEKPGSFHSGKPRGPSSKPLISCAWEDGDPLSIGGRPVTSSARNCHFASLGETMPPYRARCISALIRWTVPLPTPNSAAVFKMP